MGSDPMKIYNIILRGIEQIEFPRHVTKTAITIIRKFCRENPTERLGYQKDGIQDIKKHRWYQGFDWEGLEARTLSPPIVPKIKDHRVKTAARRYQPSSRTASKGELSFPWNLFLIFSTFINTTYDISLDS